LTYKQAVDTALKLIDSERSEFESDLFPFFADTAQKMIAMHGKMIERTLTVEKPDNIEIEVSIPDFYRFAYTQIRGTDRQVNYFIYDNNFVTDSVGTIDVYYYAMPKTIDGETADEYEFEVDAETHNAIPYYMAYELAKDDDVALAQIMLDTWNKYMSIFKNEPKAIQKRIKNVYRRWSYE